MKRIVTLILVVMMMLCFGSIAFADNDNSRASNYFSSYGITVTPTGSGKVNITFSCSAVGTASQLGVSTYAVQRYDNGSWTAVTGWLNGSYSYGSSSHSFAKTFNGVKGEKYRVKCTFLCIKNGTTETKSYTSGTVTAK